MHNRNPKTRKLFLVCRTLLFFSAAQVFLAVEKCVMCSGKVCVTLGEEFYVPDPHRSPFSVLNEVLLKFIYNYKKEIPSAAAFCTIERHAFV